jgi:uncharacterized protein (DUF1501 family)
MGSHPQLANMERLFSSVPFDTVAPAHVPGRDRKSFVVSFINDTGSMATTKTV